MKTEVSTLAPPVPVHESRRLAALRDYGVLDTPAEQGYDDLTLLAAAICDTPTAMVSLVDRDRVWFKSRLGLDVPEAPRDIAFCAHAICEPDRPLVIPDMRDDARFAHNPLVTGDAGIRFYAGAPLVTPAGEPIGTLCVVDYTPRELSERQVTALGALARQVVAQLELRRSAGTDSLTRLPNRTQIVERIGCAVERARTRPGYHFGVLYLDFDGFKQVNDRYGHAVGDELLRQMAQRLHRTLRGHDAVGRLASASGTAARLGGDEFVVLLDELTEPDDAARVAQRLLETLAEPYFIDGHVLHCSASIGIVTSAQGCVDADAVLRCADTAMYEAKRSGPGGFRVHAAPVAGVRVRLDSIEGPAP